MAQTEKAIEKQTGTLAAPSPELLAQFEADAKENLANVSDAYYKVSIQGARYKVNGNIIGNMGVTFDAVIVREAPVNTFYSVPFNPANPTPPDCWSIGGVKPGPTVDNKQSESCSTCKKNRYGTGVDAQGVKTKGKACNNSRRLVLKVEGVDLPVLLNLPPTSTKDFDQYLKTLYGQKRPVFGVVTQFGFDASVQYPRPIVAFVRDLSGVEYNEVKEMRSSPNVEGILSLYGADDAPPQMDAAVGTDTDDVF